MSIITSDTVVFDIGAHHGESAVAFLQAGASRVISVEPDYTNYCFLHHVSQSNRAIVPVHAACSSFSGRLMEIFRCVSQDGLSTTRKDQWASIYPESEWAPGEYVISTTLDDLAAAFLGKDTSKWPPIVVKIDVEGNELEVISGGMGCLMDQTGVVVFEFHEQTIGDATAALSKVSLAGFRMAGYIENDVDVEFFPSTSIWTCTKRLQTERPKWGNITVTR